MIIELKVKFIYYLQNIYANMCPFNLTLNETQHN